MRYLLRKPRKEVEVAIVLNLRMYCERCDLTRCASSSCFLRNGKLAGMFKFLPSRRKHWIFYFMHNPSRNWSFPSKTKGLWHIHHLDGDHYNDSKENLVMLRNGDHLRLHTKKYFQESDRPIHIGKREIGITQNEDYLVFQL